MPHKYFRRRDKFLAVKFTPERYAEIRSFTNGRLYHDKTKDTYALFTYGDEFPIRNGDYITESHGEFEVWTEDVFEALFEVVPGQDD